MKKLLKKLNKESLHRYHLYHVHYDLFEGNKDVGSATSIVKAKNSQEAIQLTREHNRAFKLEVWIAEELSFYNRHSHWLLTSYNWSEEYKTKTSVIAATARPDPKRFSGSAGL